MSIFGKKVPPLRSIMHSALGKLSWSQEEKGWIGEINELAFCLSHEGGPEPTAELLAYAESLLSPPRPLFEGLNSAKRAWLAKYPNNASEIEPLKYDQVAFYRHKGKNRVFAMLGPEAESRAWWIEFQEDKCTGVGFDS
jgi:hypothetical protein